MFTISCSDNKESVNPSDERSIIKVSPSISLEKDTIFLSYIHGINKQQFAITTQNLEDSGIINKNCYNFYLGTDENDYFSSEIDGQFSNEPNEKLNLITLTLIGDKIANKASEDLTLMRDFNKETIFYFDSNKVTKLINLYNSKYGKPAVRVETEDWHTISDLKNSSNVDEGFKPSPIKCTKKIYTYESAGKHIEILTYKYTTRTNNNYSDEYRLISITYQSLKYYRQNEKHNLETKDSIVNSIKEKLKKPRIKFDFMFIYSYYWTN
ncbi:MAG: hypothetical protein IPI65_00120 [Bacteroidetes bacterium]|nr:hypothetical protein [Bacteroidota bacterium]